MGESGIPVRQESRALRIPRWSALILWPILLPLVHAVVPWGLSLLATRHGWRSGRPGAWNLLALVLVAAGFAAMIWCLFRHFLKCPRVINLSWSNPPYLLIDGPYVWSRNPMYVAALLIWIGWTLFYGSIPIMIVMVVVGMGIAFWMVPAEERVLEARYGETYLRYKSQVPRWMGRVRV
jgi:protein-S-isoprenylcysteine O-methyltransferase Ste14